MYRGQRWVLCPVYRTHNADAARGGCSAGRVALGRWRGLLASAPTRRAIYGIVQTQCNVSNGYFYAHARFFLVIADETPARCARSDIACVLGTIRGNF